MSCEQPVHSASQSEIRSQILRDANNQYNSHIRALDASTQDDSAINIQIVELMEQMLQNNIDNADLLEGQKERLQRIENSLTVNKNYLQSLRDSIELNEDSKRKRNRIPSNLRLLRDAYIFGKEYTNQYQ